MRPAAGVGATEAPTSGELDALLDSAGFARALLEQSPFSTVVYDRAGRPLYANPAFERLWNARLVDVPAGYSVLSDPQLEKQGALPFIRRAFDGEAAATPPVRYEMAEVTGTGRTMWSQGHFFPLRGPAGVTMAVVLVHVDLTARFEAEEALRSSEERYRHLVEHAADAIFVADLEGRYTDVNSNGLRLLGYSRDELLRLTILDLIPPEDAPRLAALRQHLLTGGSADTSEWSVRRADGEVVPVEISTTILADGRWQAIVRDVTERRRVEAALRRAKDAADQARERLGLALQAGKLGTWELDSASGRMTCSVQCKANYGLPAGAPFDYADLLAATVPEDLPAMEAAARQALEHGGDYEAEYRVRWPDGSVHWIAASGRATLDAAGAPARMVGVTQDVTAARDAERERLELLDRERAARREAERANRAKSEFLAVMSHELRTPLNAIGGYAELLEMGIRGPVTDQQRDDLERIQRAQRHLLALINDVLNYAKLEAGSVQYRVRRVLTSELLAGLEVLIAPQVEGKSLRYRCDECAAPRPTAVLADAEKVRQILLNLLSNAVKFTPSGGAVRVAVHDDPGAVRIAITDTGVGIPADKLESIFEPFVTLARGLTHNPEGTGLGLAISRELARAMGGDLTVASEIGVGSTFTLTLPAA